jgi:aspartyl/asparaginyl-tRNA synthetase
VTGSARGIGRAAALRLAADGLDVAVHYRASAAAADAVAAEVRTLGVRAATLQADVTVQDEAERLVGRWAKEEHGSDFVFVTQYPEAARPFYTYPTGDGLTRGLDLLFRGTEITSGGQRVHDPDVLVQALEKRGMDPRRFEGYLEVFRHGMPPHGGFAIGTERLTALLVGLSRATAAACTPERRQGRPAAANNGAARAARGTSWQRRHRGS